MRLLAESMRQTGKTAVGRHAARGKQYIVQLRAVPGGLVMQQLLYAPEVRTIADVGIEEAPVRDTELALAKQLIAQISSKKFDPSAYEDDGQEAHRGRRFRRRSRARKSPSRPALRKRAPRSST